MESHIFDTVTLPSVAGLPPEHRITRDGVTIASGVGPEVHRVFCAETLRLQTGAATFLDAYAITQRQLHFHGVAQAFGDQLKQLRRQQFERRLH